MNPIRDLVKGPLTQIKLKSVTIDNKELLNVKQIEMDYWVKKIQQGYYIKVIEGKVRHDCKT
jgi:hypothetical protein